MSFLLSKTDLHPPTAKWYTEYIQSEKWTKFKASIMEVRGELCERCLESQFSLHHKTYARLFNELPEDVELLCKPCHILAHAEDYIPFLYLIYEKDLENVKQTLEYTKPYAMIDEPEKRKRKTQQS